VLPWHVQRSSSTSFCRLGSVRTFCDILLLISFLAGHGLSLSLNLLLVTCFRNYFCAWFLVVASAYTTTSDLHDLCLCISGIHEVAQCQSIAPPQPTRSIAGVCFPFESRSSLVSLLPTVIVCGAFTHRQHSWGSLRGIVIKGGGGVI
jgi:hypothetical protein